MYWDKPVTRHKKPKTRVKSRVFLTFIILVAVVSYAATSIIEKHLLHVEPVTAGVLEESIYVPAKIFVNGEKIVAPVSGEVEYLVEDGKRIPVGRVIARVNAVGTDNDGNRMTWEIKSPVAGIVDLSSPEAAIPLNTEVVSQMDLRELYSLGAEARQVSGVVRQGQTIARIINNLQPALVVVKLTPEFYPGLKQGDKIIVIHRGIQDFAVVKRMQTVQGERLALLQVPASLVSGDVNTSLVLKGRNFRGFIIPKTALGRKNGGAGVYVVHEGTLRWRPVEIVGELDSKVAVTGLEEKMEVVQDITLVDGKN